MKYCKACFLILFVVVVHFSVSSRDLGLKRHQFSIGPQWNYLKREKKDGTHQDGSLWGALLNYDRLKRYGLYWGLSGSYAYGNMEGHLGSGEKSRSHFTDTWTEGRFGYTFQQKTCIEISTATERLVNLRFAQETEN